MEEQNVRLRLSGERRTDMEPISFPASNKPQRLAFFLIFCASILAVFAVSAFFIKGTGWKEGAPDFGGDGQNVALSGSQEGQMRDPLEDIPAKATPVVSMDLSYAELGSGYLHNETPYTPKLSQLLSRELPTLKGDGEVRVLILHTHTSESYLEQEVGYLEGEPGDLTYSQNASQNMISVGRALADVLNEKGITAIHCTVMHDSPTLGGSYERSAETVRQYMEAYPTITLVIDLHRDAVLTSSGEYIRTQSSSASVAQVMPVVGSDCNGTRHDRWEENLALALQLREALNQSTPNVCRPISLRKASYNQELAPYFLLLEIGSGANTVEEAQNAARLVGNTLAELLYAR